MIDAHFLRQSILNPRLYGIESPVFLSEERDTRPKCHGILVEEVCAVKVLLNFLKSYNRLEMGSKGEVFQDCGEVFREIFPNLEAC